MDLLGSVSAQPREAALRGKDLISSVSNLYHGALVCVCFSLLLQEK